MMRLASIANSQTMPVGPASPVPANAASVLLSHTGQIVAMHSSENRLAPRPDLETADEASQRGNHDCNWPTLTV